jgi:hypothetical protein
MLLRGVPFRVPFGFPGGFLGGFPPCQFTNLPVYQSRASGPPLERAERGSWGPTHLTTHPLAQGAPP